MYYLDINSISLQLADKDVEIFNNVEKINWLEEKINKLQDNLIEVESKYKDDVEKMKMDLKPKELMDNKPDTINDKKHQAMVNNYSTNFEIGIFRYNFVV